MKTIKQFIRDECANYFSELNTIKDYCCMEKFPNNKCVYFSDVENPQCYYFEECVLPLDKELEIVYYAQQEKGALSKDEVQTLINSQKIQSICARCGKVFYANHNRQKYCELCASIIRREKNRERVQKHRRGIV